MTIFNYTNMEFSFEMFWKKNLISNNGFQKGKLDISNRNRQFKSFKVMIINLETILSIIDFEKIFGFEN